MGCGIDVYRTAIGLFLTTLILILTKRANRSARQWTERKLQAAMTMLAALTLLSLLVQGGVERNPGPDFEAAVEKIYKLIDSRLSQFEQKFTRLSMDVRECSSRIEGMQDHINYIEDRCVTTDDFEKRMKMLENRIEHCEIFSRRENLIVRGVAEESTDSYDSCKRVVIEILRKCVPEKEWTEEDIVRVHRLGKLPQGHTQSQTPHKPRPIIARFKLWQDKLRVVANRTARANLRRMNIRVDDDLTQLQREKLHSLKEEGRYAFFRGEKLVIRKPPPSHRDYDRYNNRNSNTHYNNDNRYDFGENSVVNSNDGTDIFNMDPARERFPPAHSSTQYSQHPGEGGRRTSHNSSYRRRNNTYMAAVSSGSNTNSHRNPLSSGYEGDRSSSSNNSTRPSNNIVINTSNTTSSTQVFGDNGKTNNRSINSSTASSRTDKANNSGGSRSSSNNEIQKRYCTGGGNNTSDLSSQVDSRSYSTAVKDGPFTSTARNASSLPGSPVAAKTSDKAMSESVAAALRRFRYTPQKKNSRSSGTHENHTCDLNNQTKETPISACMETECSELSSQSERRPPKRPRPPSSPNEELGNHNDVTVAGDSGDEDEHVTIETDSAAHGRLLNANTNNNDSNYRNTNNNNKDSECNDASIVNETQISVQSFQEACPEVSQQ